MQLLRDERGEGRAKLIVTIIIVAFVGFSLYQFVRARIKVYDFQDNVHQLVKKYAANPRVTDDDIRVELFKLSEEKLGFRLAEEDATVTVDGQKIHVKVDYIMPVKFPLYEWRWPRNIDYEFRRF